MLILVQKISFVRVSESQCFCSWLGAQVRLTDSPRTSFVATFATFHFNVLSLTQVYSHLFGQIHMRDTQGVHCHALVSSVDSIIRLTKIPFITFLIHFNSLHDTFFPLLLYYRFFQIEVLASFLL